MAVVAATRADPGQLVAEVRPAEEAHGVGVAVGMAPPAAAVGLAQAVAGRIGRRPAAGRRLSLGQRRQAGQ